MTGAKTRIVPRPGGRRVGPEDSEKTRIRPRPGGQGTGQGAPAAGGTTIVRPRGHVGRRQLLLQEVPQPGRATLVSTAGTLLSLAIALRQLEGDIDVQSLHRQVVHAVKTFQERAEEAGAVPERVARARYMLCSLVDETVLNTPWGEDSDWGRRTLLHVFHRETYGGDGVFRLIDEELGAARKDTGLLELAYLCLSLGFEGRYRLRTDGRSAIERLRTDLHDAIEDARGRGPTPLSPDAGRTVHVTGRLQSFLFVWVLAACLALTAFGVYTYLLFDLNRRSDEVIHALAAVVPPVSAPEQPAASPIPLATRLRGLLAPEIRRGAIRIESGGGKVRIVLPGDGLFDSGAASLKPRFDPVVDKLARALEAVPGRVTIAGYTDDRPIRTPRFPSNWQLSLARANAVAQRMAAAADLSGRLVPEGRGASDPVADNGTRAGRKRNRRVSIEMAATAAAPLRSGSDETGPSRTRSDAGGAED